MVALAIKGRLEAEGLWRLARGERRVKVRARLSAIADLLDGGAERPSALACPRGAVQHPGIKPGLLLRSQLVREPWPTGLPISAPWRSASSGSATAFLACASFCTGLDFRGFSRAHATPRATPRPRPSSKKSAADGRRGRGGPPRSDIDRTLVPGRDADRPEGYANPAVGPTGPAAPGQARSRLRLRLSLRRRLSRARQRRRRYGYPFSWQ